MERIRKRVRIRKNSVENVTVIQNQRVIKDYAVGIYTRVSTSHKSSNG